MVVMFELIIIEVMQTRKGDTPERDILREAPARGMMYSR